MSNGNWKHTGALLTGVAALVTASIPIFSFLKETTFTNAKEIQKLVSEQPSKKKQYAFIDDPDGWVNLRKEPNSQAYIITKIENGYRVEILEKNGNWYKVKTFIDDVGYIYSDRLLLQK